MSADHEPVTILITRTVRAGREAVFEEVAAGKWTVWELEGELGALSDAFAPTECCNFFRGCGYSDDTP